MRTCDDDLRKALWGNLSYIVIPLGMAPPALLLCWLLGASWKELGVIGLGFVLLAVGIVWSTLDMYFTAPHLLKWCWFGREYARKTANPKSDAPR